jgi:hypothetical protein
MPPTSFERRSHSQVPSPRSGEGQGEAFADPRAFDKNQSPASPLPSPLRGEGKQSRTLAGQLPSVISALVALAASSVAQAQTLELPRPRQGYYVGVGLLGAVNQNWEKGASLGAWPGSGFSLRLGQLITRRFGLGLQIDSGSTKKGEQRTSAFSLGLEAQWELAPNLALHGGSGLGVVSITDPNDGIDEARGAFGAAYTLGLSYDWFFTHRSTGGWAVTPHVKAGFIPGDDTKSLLLFFGVEIAYWTGLPSNQLELPAGEGYGK